MTLVQLKYVIAVAGQNSLNDAAKVLFISQPSLSSAIHSLENEIGFDIFIRSKNGITLTTKGAEFIGYAKSVMEQYELLDAKYISQTEVKKTFSVSMQHYTFAVNAFVEMVKQFGMNEYEFAIRETKTYEVIEDVKNFKSEIGILYINEFNKKVLDVEGVYYQSVMSKMKNVFSASFPLNLGYILCKIFDGENDGLVEVNSGKWGNFLGLITAKKRGISHGDVIDLTRIDIEDFNVCEFYVNLVSKLKDMGF